MYLLPQITDGKEQFATPTTSEYIAIDFLETMLIGLAIKRNPDLANIDKTKMPRKLEVKGFYNSQNRLPNRRYGIKKIWDGAAGLRNVFDV